MPAIFDSQYCFGFVQPVALIQVCSKVIAYGQNGPYTGHSWAGSKAPPSTHYGCVWDIPSAMHQGGAASTPVLPAEKLILIDRLPRSAKWWALAAVPVVAGSDVIDARNG